MSRDRESTLAGSVLFSSMAPPPPPPPLLPHRSLRSCAEQLTQRFMHPKIRFGPTVRKANKCFNGFRFQF